MSFFSLLAQPIYLEFNQAETGRIIFPCKDIATCIDTLYGKGDTLFIKLIDNRTFILSSNKRQLDCIETFYSVKANKFVSQLNISTKNNEYNFIKMQIFNKIYFFKKDKKRYVLVSRDILEDEKVLEILEENNIRFPIPTPINSVVLSKKSIKRLQIPIQVIR